MSDGAIGILIFTAIIVATVLIVLKIIQVIRIKMFNKKVLNYGAELTTLKNTIATLEEQRASLEEQRATLDAETKDLQDLRHREQEIAHSLEEKSTLLSTTLSRLQSIESEEQTANEKIHTLRSKIDLYSRIDDFVDYGHYEMPQYLYETSERFALEIKKIRDAQKKMIADKAVITGNANTGYPFEGSVVPRLFEEQKKLMIRSFNIECDLLIEKVNPSNIARTLERIENIANTLEKSSIDLRFGFDIAYIKLKFEECTLQYQFLTKKKEEQEEQKAIREQMREEEKARREYEQAIAKAEKEESMYQQLLEKARQELATSSAEERAAAELRIQQLEGELAEAQAKAERAKSMAEQTKKGHVYVISNIGSFGEDVYKIGLTRRLDPTERVKELGDASVPFSFDIHAMIYSDDAPNLENSLHKVFTDYRVNAVNTRKEFFKVSLHDIKKKVEEISSTDAEFITTILAEEYYQTKRLRQSV